MQYSLITPQALFQEMPASSDIIETVVSARKNIRRIFEGKDHRLLVIVGPCSIHDTVAALEYAHLLQRTAEKLADELFIVMRAYFEKPRTSIGWKGFIRDPFLNDSFDINQGLQYARKLLLDLAHLDMPAGTEFLDMIVPHYISDLIAWGVVGARTSESQIHRELASGLNLPVGFKNSTHGNINIAIDAVKTASQPHHFISINQQGTSVITQTSGNDACHIILRGSHLRTNYSPVQVKNAVAALSQNGLPPRLMIDCSHGNSRKEYSQQARVLHSVAKQISQGSRAILGVMLESHLIAGRQLLQMGQPLVYGQSITDGCLSWQETVPLLEKLARAVRKRKMDKGV